MTYRARRPPIISAIDNRIPPRARLIRIHKIFDPAHHRRGAQSIASGARRIVFDIQHPWQGDAVIRPSAAMGEEVVRLRSTTAFVGMGKVIAAADETGGGCAAVVSRE